MKRTYGNRTLSYYRKLMEKESGGGARRTKDKRRTRHLPLSKISRKTKYKFSVDLVSASAQEIARDAIRDNPSYKVAKLRLDNIIKFAIPSMGEGKLDMKYIKKIIEAENIIRKEYDVPLDREEDLKKLDKAEKALSKKQGKRSEGKLLKLPIRTSKIAAAGRTYRK